MNKVKIQVLLDRWAKLIHISERISREKAKRITGGGLLGRIQRTTGTPVIFDNKTYVEQRKLQNLLCQELPQFADLIKSTPPIMDGHPWIRNDFIELYFKHFRLVVAKLERIIKQPEQIGNR